MAVQVTIEGSTNNYFKKDMTKASGHDGINLVTLMPVSRNEQVIYININKLPKEMNSLVVSIKEVPPA